MQRVCLYIRLGRGEGPQYVNEHVWTCLLSLKCSVVCVLCSGLKAAILSVLSEGYLLLADKGGGGICEHVCTCLPW